MGINRFEELSARSCVKLQQELGGTLAIHRIFGMAVAAGARTCGIELQSHGDEYASEYKALYKHITKYSKQKFATRVHFFTEKLGGKNDLHNSSEPGYLGYAELRPTNPPQVAWALLDKELIVGENNRFLYVTCHRKYKVFVDEREFTVDAFPYIQQDGVVVRCAQAALAAMASHVGSELTGPEFTAQTELDSDCADRAIPSPGLTARQICMGVRAMNRDPLLLAMSGWTPEERCKAKPEEIIYNYVESGIPVLIGIETAGQSHAIIAIGHTFTPDSWMAEGESGYYGFPKPGGSCNWVRRFVVQDDNFGPYTLAPVELIREVAFLMAAPLPYHIYTGGQEAAHIAQHLLTTDGGEELVTRTYEVLEQKNVSLAEKVEFWRDQLKSAVKQGRVVLRPRLMAWDDYCLQHTVEGDYEAEFQEAVGELAVPAHVWCVEISWPDIFCHQRLCVGELVLDASSPAALDRDPSSAAWILLRIPGALVWRNLQSEDGGIIPITQDACVLGHYQCNC